MLNIDICSKELNRVMQNTIEESLKISDKYELDRDETIKTMAEKISLMAEIGTFKDYKIKDEENNHNGWISCSEQMPKEHDSIFARFKGTNKWKDSMFEKASNEVNVTVANKKGDSATTHAHTLDGKWSCDFLKCNKSYQIIAWQPLPEPYKSSVAQSSPEQKAANWKDSVMRTFTNTEESNYG